VIVLRFVPSAGARCALLLAATMPALAQEAPAMAPDDACLLLEDFENGMDNWWVEGAERVWVEDGRLHVKADPPEGSDAPFVATVWCRTPIEGNVRIEFDTHVVSSSTDANNINLFMFFSDPSGAPLYDTRADRADAEYAKYHRLNGNIITFLNEPAAAAATPEGETPPARIRIRHCPGFELLAETYNYRCRQGETYHVTVERRNDFIRFFVDGRYLLGVRDAEPWPSGLLGLRTFRTHLWWDNIRVTKL
jgi:hypothetical protein